LTVTLFDRDWKKVQSFYGVDEVTYDPEHDKFKFLLGHNVREEVWANGGSLKVES